jgi:hypothetical protein
MLSTDVRDNESKKFREATIGTKVAVTIEEDSLLNLIDQPDSNTTYIGEAPRGSSESSPVWRITRVLKSGTQTSIKTSGESFDSSWSLRETLTYE